MGLEPIDQGSCDFIQGKHAPALLQELSSSAERGFHEGVMRAAHTLKSASAQVGLLELRELCEKLEEHGKNRGDFSEISEWIQQAKAVFEKEKATLEAYGASSRRAA